MIRLPKPKSALFLSLLLLLAMYTAGHAQDDKAESWVDDVFDLAGNVGELRLFLTREPGVARGEIATVGATAVTALPVEMEEETVTFLDDGAAPDRIRGDGVFTAQFKYDVVGEFQALRAGLEATIDVLGNSNSKVLIRRGPRDIVAAADVIESAERDNAEALGTARQQITLAQRLLDFQDPLSAAEALGVDIDTVPLLRLPGPRFGDLPARRVKFDHLFDFPVFALFPPPAPTIPIVRERSLMITAKSVVEDDQRSFDACTKKGTPGGVWSFGHLMRELAYGTGLTPEEFTRIWLSSWETTQKVNGWKIDNTDRKDQLKSLVIDTWQRLSPHGILDVDYFPARLLAIVNRPDLAGDIGFGTAGSAGEGRLVFGLVIPVASGQDCRSIGFTLIFEYAVAGGSCLAVKDWQRRWKDLGKFKPGSNQYNRRLEMITRNFTDHGSNPSQLPNTSSLAQLRTNENALAGEWQLREFQLQEAGLLGQVTVKQTPANEFNEKATLRMYLETDQSDILAERHRVPALVPGTRDPFLGAVADNESSLFHWTAPNLDGISNWAEVRRKFSLATCSGCHSGETNTEFTHIGILGGRAMGREARLFGFLLGEDVTVPVSLGKWRYEDLEERETKMRTLLGRKCFVLLAFERLPFAH